MIISLILPCYNPPPHWEQVVNSSYSAFSKEPGDVVELIIVLDGTNATVTPESIAFLKQHIPAAKIVEYPANRGKGYALRQGVKAAAGSIIMYTDIDFPYALASMHEVLDILKNNEADVAVGIKNDAYYSQVPFVRRLISKYLRVLIRLFLSMPVTDTQCGLKGFKKEVAPLFLQTTIDRYLFDLEFIHNCYKSKKLRVKAIPVSLNDNVRFRKMNYRILLPEMANFIKLLFGNR